MNLNKIVLMLALMALMIICGVLVEAEPQVFPPIGPKVPIITTSTSGFTSITLPIPTSQSTSKAPPPSSPAPPPISKQPIQPSTSPSLTPSLTPTPTPTAPQASPSVQSSPSVQPPSDSCSKANRICPDSGMFCNISLRKCQPKGGLGDSCNNNNECSDPFVCNKNACQYNVSGSNQNDKHYNVKKVAIIGAIVVGVSGVCGLVFFVYRQFKNRNDYDITSRLYSTDDDISEPDPYPFNERSNSFSNNAVQQPSRAHYDNLPPARNRGFAAPHQGYNNYYNEYNNNNNEGRYMRQNENGNVTRTMNLLQQTRGNVVATPPQNYNRNPPPVQQPQSGLFPIPSVKGNYGVPIPPNNMNYNNNNNSSENLNHNQPKASSRYSVDYSVNRNNQHVRTNPPRELSKDSSTLPVPSNLKQKNKKSSTDRDSFFDYYTRDSFFAKTLENKLPIFKRNKNDLDPERKTTVHDTASRTQTFGYDPKLVKSSESSTVEEVKKIV